MSGQWTGRRVGRDRAWWTAILAATPVPCAYCGLAVHVDEDWQIDHAVPRALGGALGRHNQRPVHAACNARAGQTLTTRCGRRLRPWETP